MKTRRQRAPIRPAAVALLVALSLLPLAPAAPAASALDSDAVARWTFDEGSGSTAADSIGDANATREGAAWLTGDPKVGAAALSFDGVGDRVVVPDGGGLELP